MLIIYADSKYGLPVNTNKSALKNEARPPNRTVHKLLEEHERTHVRTRPGDLFSTNHVFSIGAWHCLHCYKPYHLITTARVARTSIGSVLARRCLPRSSSIVPRRRPSCPAGPAATVLRLTSIDRRLFPPDATSRASAPCTSCYGTGRGGAWCGGGLDGLRGSEWRPAPAG